MSGSPAWTLVFKERSPVVVSSCPLKPQSPSRDTELQVLKAFVGEVNLRVMLRVTNRLRVYLSLN